MSRVASAGLPDAGTEAPFASYDASRRLDPDRLAAVRATGLLDAPSAPTLDRLTRLAARLLGAPVVLVTLLDAERQVFASQHGLGEPLATVRETPLSHSFCQHVVALGVPLSIGAAASHPLVHDNPAIAELGVAAYLGTPLVDARGQRLGSLCAIDHVPREWAPEALATLQDLAAGAVAELELRRTARALAETTAALGELLDTSTELVCAADAEGRITYANRAWLRAMGFASEDVVGLRAIDLVAEEHRGRYRNVARRLYAGEAIEDYEAVLVGADGRRVVCRGRASATMVPDASVPGGQRCVGTRAVYRDVTAERQAQAARARLVATLEATSDFVGTMSPDGRLEYVNRAGRRLLGLAPDADVATLRAPALLAPETLARLRSEGAPAAIATGEWAGEGALLGADGAPIPVSISIVAHPGLAPDEPPYFSAIMRDVRERVAAEAALRASEARFRAVFESAGVGVSVIDDRGTVLQVNAAFADFLGYPIDALVGRYAPDLSPSDDAELTRAPVADVRAGRRQSVTVEKRFYRADGEVRWASLTVSRIPLENGTLGTIGLTTDVTPRRMAQAAMQESEERYRFLAESNPTQVWTADADGMLDFVNACTRAYHGLGNEALYGDRWIDVVHPDDVPASAARWRHSVETGEPYETEFRLRRADGVYRWHMARAQAMRDATGRIVRWFGTNTDIDERRHAQATLERERAFLAATLESLSDGVVACDAEGRLTLFNRATREFHGLPEAPLPPDAWTRHYSLYRADGVTPLPTEEIPLRRAFAGEEVHDAELVIAPVDGEPRVVRANGRSIVDAAGAQLGAVIAMRDVTGSRRTEAALRESEARFRGVLETVRAVAMTLDARGRVTFANDALLHLTGWTRDEVVDHDWFARFVPGDAAMHAIFTAMLAGAESVAHHESELLTRDGERRLVAWDVTVLRDAAGAVVGTASIGRDVTEQRALEQRLAALSEHDELTGVFNRRGFRRMLEHGVKSAGRTGARDALLFLDLDRFKTINDTHGHPAGDAALRAVADVLRATIRDADFAGRLGGDEFAVYAVGLRESGEGHVLASRLQAALAAHNGEAAAAGRPFEIAFSIGVAEVEAGDTAETLLARADAALYARKLARRR
jgi:diguanylate cyclase (GGDEF)-like protein/PAS domain S-box-containing protein